MGVKINLPDKETLSKLLSETWDVHSEYQENYLNGERDAMWAGWYAGFLLGRLGNFTTPTTLTRLLQEMARRGIILDATHSLSAMRGGSDKFMRTHSGAGCAVLVMA